MADRCEGLTLGATGATAASSIAAPTALALTLAARDAASRDAAAILAEPATSLGHAIRPALAASPFSGTRQWKGTAASSAVHQGPLPSLSRRRPRADVRDSATQPASLQDSFYR
jgi:hypothetical protein